MKYFLQTLKWMLLWPLDFVFNLVCVLLVNWWIIFLARPVPQGTWLYDKLDAKWRGIVEDLPTAFKWFETFDASLDTGWTSPYFVDRDTYSPTNLPSYWKRKYYQWRWLNRNSGYSFSYYVLGIPVDKSEWAINKFKWVPGDTGTGYGLFIATSSKGYWNISLDGKWGSYNLGWKIWNYWDKDIQTWYRNNKPWGPEWRTTIVMSVNPFKRKAIPALDPEHAGW
jgi:hypothetical protein